MSRLSRKEIKKDEVREGAARLFHYLQEHARAIGIGLVVALVALLATVAWFGFAEKRRARLNDELGAAIKLYQAPIDSGDSELDGADQPSFSSEEERAVAARAAFTELYDRIGSNSVGAVAAAYLADLAAQKGDYETARGLWQEATVGGANVLTAELMVNRIALDRSSGSEEAVLAELSSLAEDTSGLLPQVVVLDQMAETLLVLGRDEEAREIYQRIVDEFPTSAYSRRASEELR